MSQQMQVTIPPEIGPGQSFPIRTLFGNIVHVTCPQDKVGGMIMIVTIDEKNQVVPTATAPTVQAVQAVVQPTPVQPTPVMAQQPTPVMAQQPTPVIVQQPPPIMALQSTQYMVPQQQVVHVVQEPVMVRQTVRTLRPDDLLNGPTGGVCPNCKESIVTHTENETCTKDQCGVVCATSGVLLLCCRGHNSPWRSIP